MNNPEQYSKSNSISRLIATECFNEFAPKFKWLESGERVIDVGCADGSVTCILKKYVPSNYEKFVACDINPNMLEYAKEHSDQNITFRVLDIQEDIPDDLKCGFDHVVSSLLFHMVPKTEEGFKGIYDLMAPGGECFLTFFGYNSVMHAYEVISNDPDLKWGSGWLKNVGRFVSVYVHMKDPVKYVTDIFKKIGYTNIDVQYRKKRFLFPNISSYKDIIRAVDVFDMPDDVFEEFFLDYILVAKRIGVIPNNLSDLSDVTTEVPLDYGLVTVHARKPI